MYTIRLTLMCAISSFFSSSTCRVVSSILLSWTRDYYSYTTHLCLPSSSTLYIDIPLCNSSLVLFTLVSNSPIFFFRSSTSSPSPLLVCCSDLRGQIIINHPYLYQGTPHIEPTPSVSCMTVYFLAINKYLFVILSIYAYLSL